jgi:hypothetical protein
MRLVLIDNRIPDIHYISESFTEEVEYIVFDFHTDTIDTIQDKIVEIFGRDEVSYKNRIFTESIGRSKLVNYESVAIIQHNYNLSNYQLVANCSPSTLTDLATEDPALESWREYITFLVWLKTERGVAYVDLLACGLWANENWKYLIETVREREGVHIRASLDITGAGGDFVLESDGVDMVGIYFTEKILEYKYAFYAYGYPYMPGYSQYLKYTTPVANLGSITSNYTSMTGGGALNLSNIISVSSNGDVYGNGGGTAILKSDNSVSVYGGSSYGGAGYITQQDPVFTFSATNLTNVKKIVSSSRAFCALTNGGSVYCWGDFNSTYDINNNPSATFTNFNSVKSQLQSNVVDIFSTSSSFAALTNTGKVIIWGTNSQGGKVTIQTSIDFLSSGVQKVFFGGSVFVALKSNNTALFWGENRLTPNENLITSYPLSSAKIIDVFSNQNTSFFLIQNADLTKRIVSVKTQTVIYDNIPENVNVLKYAAYFNAYYNCLWLLSNHVLIVEVNEVVATVSNVYDVAATWYAYAYILKNTTNNTYSVVPVGDEANGGSLTNLTTGIVGSRTITSPIRLVSTIGSIGAIQHDNTFVWWGQVLSYKKSNIPPVHNSITGTNIKNVYCFPLGYIIAITNGSSPDIFYSIGVNKNNIPPNGSSTSITKQVDNVRFETIGSTGAVAIEIPYLPSVSPTSITKQLPTSVSYYVSNPDLIGYTGRTYDLYHGETRIDTIIPTQDIHTYVFPNVNITTGSAGPITLSIKDSTIPEYMYSVVDFSINLFLPIYVPTAPTITTITSGNNTLNMAFTAPANNGGNDITNYSYSTNGINGPYVSIGQTTSPFLITADVFNGTTYEVALRAQNAAGNSSPSSLLSGTPFTNPDAPTITSLVRGNNSLTVNFTLSSNNGNAITTYLYSQDGGALISMNSTVSPFVINTGLLNGNSYAVRVFARNAAGNSIASNAVSGIPFTNPGAPTITTIASGNRTLNLNFTAPVNNGGNAITNYSYSIDSGPYISIQQTTSPYLITTAIPNNIVYNVSNSGAGAYIINGANNLTVNLIRGVRYTFSINASGHPFRIQTTPITYNSANAYNDGITNNGVQVGNLTFQVGDNAPSVLYYVCQFHSSMNGTINIRDVVEADAISLSNGTSYSVNLRAQNNAGNSIASTAVSAIPFTNPDAPTITSIAGGNDTLNMSFTAPANNGGNAISDYLYSIDGTTYIPIGKTTSPFLITTNVFNGTPYSVTLKAINVSGDSSQSNPVDGTPFTKPGAPIINALIPGNSSIAISFGAPVNNGGNTITDYQYSFSQNESYVSIGAVPRLYSIPQTLVNGTSYTIYMKAVNAAGSTFVASSATATPITVPNAPVINALLPGNTTLDISFSAPLTTGGNAITNYQYSFSPNTGYVSIGAIPITYRIPETLVNGTSYTIYMKAVNAAGSTLIASSATATPKTVPGAPVINALIPKNRALDISFGEPLNNGGDAITNYQYSFSPNTGYVSIGPIPTTYTVSELTNGTSYTIYMKATNTAGTTLIASSRTILLILLPSAPIINGILPRNAILDVSFSAAPIVDGDAEITDYQYSFSPDTSYISIGSIPITYSITGLVNGRLYTIYMKAVNAVGSTLLASSATGTPFASITRPSTAIPNIIRMRSSFSNNLTFYKKGSLSTSGGGSGVANSRAKRNRT